MPEDALQTMAAVMAQRSRTVAIMTPEMAVAAKQHGTHRESYHMIEVMTAGKAVAAVATMAPTGRATTHGWGDEYGGDGYGGCSHHGTDRESYHTVAVMNTGWLWRL